jgi:hypothetical protein
MKNKHTHFSKEEIKMTTVYEKVLKITTHQENTNQNHNERCPLIPIRMSVGVLSYLLGCLLVKKY